jgi:ribonuclease P protein component
LKRLKTRQQFQAVLGGETLARTAHFALHCTALSHAAAQQNQQPELFAVHDVWLGALVPKRWARRAVTRNAIKRQVYTVGGGFELSLARAAHVVRLRASFDRTRFVSASSDALKTALRQELLQLFGKAIRPAQAVSAERA